MKTIQIDGVIGWDVFASDVSKSIKEANGDDLTIEINSPGGLVTEGIAIFNAIKKAKGTKTTNIVGIAASMGSYIALASDKVVAEANSIFMIHNASMFAGGDHRDLRKAADVSEAMSNVLASEYVKKTGKTLAEIKTLMDNETFLFGGQIKDLGFADEVNGKETEDSAIAVSKTKSLVSSAHSLISRLTTEGDIEQAAAMFGEFRNVEPVAVGNDKATGPKKIEGVSKMTQDEIDALVAKAYQDGIDSERKRVAELEAIIGLSAESDAIAKTAISDGRTYADVSVQLMGAIAKSKTLVASGENPPLVSASVPATASGSDGLDDTDREAQKLFNMSAEDYKLYSKKGVK